jgi:predicted RNA-binding Zn ribbon-like protein
MTVSDNFPPSRAATLVLVGGELAFDLANTSSGRGSSDFHEHLRMPSDVANWAEHAHLLLPEDAEWLKAATHADVGLGEHLLRSLTMLREDIYEVGSELAAGRSPAIAPVDRIRAVYARCLDRAHLSPFSANFAWTWSTRSAPVESVLGPVSLSALTILMQADLTRVKQCQGDKCGWLFLDTTKNKSRRWCEMEVCGNRAKQKRLAKRVRGA